MDEPYHIGFVADETPDARELYNRCLEAGMKTTHDGQTDVVAEYNIGLTAHTDSSLETALKALEKAETGSLYFWMDSGMKFRVGFTNPASQDEEWIGRTSISFQTSEIDRDTREDSVYRARIDELLALVAELVPVVDPEYVWSSVYRGHESYKRLVPDGEPIAEHVDNLSWVTVLSAPLVEQFGGREYVFDAPAWQVREFDSRHIMLVLQNHPYDAMKPAHSSSETHLLDR